MSQRSFEFVVIDPEDAHNFRIGMAIVVDPHGRRMTGLRLFAWRVRDRLHRVTRWWRPRMVVTAVDVENGIVTHGLERWSWLRWRWERVA